MKKVVLVGVAVGFCCALAGPAAARKPRPVHHTCPVPSGAHLVAQNSAARIVLIDRTQGTDQLREWRYCLRRKPGGYRPLVTGGSYGGGSGDSIGVGPVMLAGEWVAWPTITIPYGGRYHYTHQGTVSVRYLGGTSTKMVSEGGGSTCAFRQLVLSPTGIAAWEVALCLYPTTGPTYSLALQAMNGRSGKNVTLDSTAFSPSSDDPFADLQLTSCVAGCVPPGGTVVWWQRDGVWHSASAP